MIDELIHYCIHEIGLDGEAGTEIDRLADFIRDFHTEHTSRSQLPAQLVDANYQAFVFRQLISHPDVSVGLFVPGVPTKSSDKRSGILKSRVPAFDNPAPSKAETQSEPALEYDWVDLLPDQSLAEQHGLFQLQQTHGDELRLVLEPAVIKRLLVGATDAFVPPSAYRVLQIICRSREKPVLSTDIGTDLHTDQKTVFYICKRLVDLGLITKIKARETGTLASYFVATKFEDRCEILIQQRNAEVAADLHQPTLTAQSQLATIAQSPSAPDASGDSMLESDEDADEHADAEDISTVKQEEPPQMPISGVHNNADQAGDNATTSVQPFTPSFEFVDAEKSLLWMSSRPELVRFRIYLVCNALPSRVTARVGLLHRINLAHDRAQKKTFISLLEHAVVDGFLEVVKVFVPSTGHTHKGLRMTSKGYDEMQDLLQGNFGDAASLQMQARATRHNLQLQQDLTRIDSRIPNELTMERLIYEEVARAGPSGRTTAQLMTKLHATGHFARAVEQFIQRAEEADADPSMSDLQIRGFHEHKLRVRSTKLYSNHAWVLQCANEGTLDQDDLDLLAAAGGPSTFHRHSSAREAPEQAAKHLASLSKDLFTPTPSKDRARIGRPPRKRPLDLDADTLTPTKSRPRKTPIKDPDAPPPKRGRPRKHPIDESGEAATPNLNTPTPKRGRPRKHPIDGSGDAASPSLNTPPPKRARKDKKSTDPSEESPVASGIAEEGVASSAARPVDSPMEEATSEKGPSTTDEVANEDEGATAAPDSPTAGAAKRRSGRPKPISAPYRATKATSHLASSPIVAESAASDTVEVTPSEKSAPVEGASQRTEEQAVILDDSQDAQRQDVPSEAAAAPVDLSRVEDLLSAPTPIKAEVGSTLPATPKTNKLSKGVSAPPTSDRKRKRNLTQLRSSHALVQCIREAGGAMDTLSIPDQLSSFVERHGFSSDTQLTNLRDKKVREKALAAAVDNGMLRRTYIRLERPDVTLPKRQIAYLPDLSAHRLHAYCEDVKHGRDGWFDTKNARTALMEVTDNVAVGSVDAMSLFMPWHTDDPYRLADLPSDSEQLAVLRQPFRAVLSVYQQHIGFLGGAMLRLKAFHHACAHYIAMRQSTTGSDGASATTTASNDTKGLELSFFWTDASLDLFLGLVPTPPVPEAIEPMALDPQIRSLPLHAIPEELKAALGLSSSVPDEAKIAFLSLATQLSELGILKVYKAADVPEGAERSSSSLDSLATIIQPLHRIPLYDWACAEQEKPLIEVMDVGLDADSINLFWAKMQACCLGMRKGERGDRGQNSDSVAQGEPGSAPGLGMNSLVDLDICKKPSEELASSIHAYRAWRPYYQLKISQKKFLHRIDLQDIPRATQDDIDRLAYVTLTPQQIVRAVLQRRLERADEQVDPDATTTRQKQPHFKWPLMLSTIDLPTNVYRPIRASAKKARKRTRAEREKQGRITTMEKARQLRQRRADQFQAMLDEAFEYAPAAHALRGKIETALRIVHRKFVSGDIRFDADAAQRAIFRAVRSALGARLMPALRTTSAGRRRRQAKQELADQDQQDDQSDQDQDVIEDHETADNSGGKSAAARRNRSARRNVDQYSFWTPTRKELLRDAAVILRVRDQVRGRSDWSALFQVIDREERNLTKSVAAARWRAQYYRMRALHGEEAYLTALESRWISVYLSAREAGELDDPDFPNPTGFDLIAQIELLRQRIDKNEVQRSLVRPTARHHLPLELSASTDFSDSWKDVFPDESVDKRFEPIFNTDANNAGTTTKRVDTLLSTALGAEAATPKDAVNLTVEELVAEWAVRIVIATSSPNTETAEGVSTDARQVDPSPVDEVAKADFCRAVGDARIEAAMQRLLHAKLIRSISFDPLMRRKPGTNFVFTEQLHMLMPDATARNRMASGDLQATLTHRRSAFEEVCDATDGLLLEPVEADGEAAAIVMLMESGLMDAELDGRAFEGLRQTTAFNARVMNDDDLEALISIQGKAGAMDAIDEAVLPLPSIPEDRALEWLTGAKMTSAAAAKLQKTWFERFDAATRTLSTDEAAAERVSKFRSRLIQAGVSGLPLDRGGDAELTYAEVQALTLGAMPLAFFSPLSSQPVLVASVFIRSFVLDLPSSNKGESRLTLPHIWTTLASASVEQWRHLLDTIVNLTLQRPGINVAWLAARFSGRAELNSAEAAKGAASSTREAVGTSFADVWAAVQCLLGSGIVEMRTSAEFPNTVDRAGETGLMTRLTLHPGSRRKMWAGFK